MQASQMTKQESDLYLQTRSQYFQNRKKNHNSSFQTQANKTDYFTIKNRIKTQLFFQKQKPYKIGSKNYQKGFKFSNQKRFSKSQCYYTSICGVQIPDSKAKTFTTFGYGAKQPISKIIMRRAIQTPSPSKYSPFMISKQSSKRHHSFCNSVRQKEDKRCIFHRQDVYSSHFTLNNPAHIYNIRQKIGCKPQTIGKKLKMYTQKMSDLYSHVPGPCYKIDERKIKNIGGIEKGASFNLGMKIDLSKPLNYNPGPKYQIHGFCDKFVKIKKKLSCNQKKNSLNQRYTNFN